MSLVPFTTDILASTLPRSRSMKLAPFVNKLFSLWKENALFYGRMANDWKLLRGVRSTPTSVHPPRGLNRIWWSIHNHPSSLTRDFENVKFSGQDLLAAVNERSLASEVINPLTRQILGIESPRFFKAVHTISPDEIRRTAFDYNDLVNLFEKEAKIRQISAEEHPLLSQWLPYLKSAQERMGG